MARRSLATIQLRLIDLAEPPARFTADIDRIAACGKRLIEERLPATMHGVATEIEVGKLTVVWCKYVEGKLRFTIGEASIDVPFAGWTCRLRPPQIVCPFTGAITYHLAATEDGRIAAAERIEICHESGRRLLATEMVTCSVTGHRATAGIDRRLPYQRATFAAQRDGIVRYVPAARKPERIGTRPLPCLPPLARRSHDRPAHGPAVARTSGARSLAGLADRRDVASLRA